MLSLLQVAYAPLELFQVCGHAPTFVLVTNGGRRLLELSCQCTPLLLQIFDILLFLRLFLNFAEYIVKLPVVNACEQLCVSLSLADVVDLVLIAAEVLLVVDQAQHHLCQRVLAKLTWQALHGETQRDRRRVFLVKLLQVLHEEALAISVQHFFYRLIII